MKAISMVLLKPSPEFCIRWLISPKMDERLRVTHLWTGLFCVEADGGIQTPRTLPVSMRCHIMVRLNQISCLNESWGCSEAEQIASHRAYPVRSVRPPCIGTVDEGSARLNEVKEASCIEALLVKPG